MINSDHFCIFNDLFCLVISEIKLMKKWLLRMPVFRCGDDEISHIEGGCMTSAALGSLTPKLRG